MSDTEPAPRSGGTQMAKAVILVVVVAVVAVLLLHHTQSPSAAGTSTTTSTTVPSNKTKPTTTTTVPLRPPSKVVVQVLNGLQAGSLSSEWSNKLKASPGYVTLAPANTKTVVDTSVIYVVTKGYLPEARALAKTVGLPDASIRDYVPLVSPFPTGTVARCNLVLIIGTSLQSAA